MQPDGPPRSPDELRNTSRFFYGYVIVAAVFLILMVTWGTYSIFGVFFNPLMTEFGWTRASLSGAFSLSTMVQSGVGIILGALSDRLGPRLITSVCMVFLGLGYYLLSQIDYLWQVYVFYGLVIGVGMSGIWVPLLSTVSRWFVKRRSLMNGIVISGIGIGSTIAPPVFSYLILTYGWRDAYVILGITVGLSGLIFAQFLKRDPASMRLLPDGRQTAAQPQTAAPTSRLPLAEILKTGQFWLLFVLIFCFGFSMFVIRVHLVPHAIDLGIPDLTAASILALSGITGVLGNFVFGGLGDIIGNRKVFVLGFIVTAAGLVWLLFSQDVWMLYIFAAVFGFTLGLGSVETPLVVDMYGLRSLGLIIGVVSVAYTTGAALGPIAAGYIFDQTGSYQWAFLLATVLAVTGMTIAMIIRTAPKKR